MSDEWVRAWEAATGVAPGEPQHRGEPDRVERLPESAGPSVGEEFASGIQPAGFTWRVEEARTGDECVLLRLFRGGEPTESVMRWPVNRWAALAEREQLSPAVRA